MGGYSWSGFTQGPRSRSRHPVPGRYTSNAGVNQDASTAKPAVGHRQGGTRLLAAEQDADQGEARRFLPGLPGQQLERDGNIGI